ncbi:MAG: hypothetical protein SGI73_08775 [Chloroflexota bacterium]|nr:hypothetical protein [Chloroflexota bacterium]
MDRTVPKTGSEEIELYMRTYYSLLRSTHTIQIETLVETHMAMESSLHVHAPSAKPDVSALVYASLRLPPCMADIEFVLIGILEKSLVAAGYPVNDWQAVYSPGRRRRTLFDGKHTLAVFIASRSDIDDLVPILTAYQIEWNKLHGLLQGEIMKLFLAQHQERITKLTDAELELLSSALRMDAADVRRLEIVWGAQFIPTLVKISREIKHISLRQIAGSLADYRRGTAYWWDDLRSQLGDVDIENRPVYFVSSNTHSLLNLLTGFALREEAALIDYIGARGHEDLLSEYHAIERGVAATGGAPSLKYNFLYYVLKKYISDSGQKPREALKAAEDALGIARIPSRHGFDIETQVIEMNHLRYDWLDPRLISACDRDSLAGSDAVILNIDYPLGLAAYEILARVTERVSHLSGIYIIGKAATLNGKIGDVMIPNVVHDEHSKNTFLFNNCFSAQDVAPYLSSGSVLDNQKAISAPGTFLQNPSYMGVFYQEGYTIIEMEAGPYLSSLYEAVRPKRHPVNEIVTLHGAPFDVGFLHYASDTPLTKGKNLGASSLSYAGVEPTYAAAVAVLRRIFSREAERMRLVAPVYSNGSVPGEVPMVALANENNGV